MSQVVSLRELFHAVSAHDGADTYAEVLAPWLQRSAAATREAFAPLSVHGRWRREIYVFGDLLELAYALGRVNDLLLLGFQPDLPPGTETPWAHELHMPQRLPLITVAEYLAFFAALGMSSIETGAFDPFFHEIVTIEQADDPHRPIEITGTRWPGLMLGELMFSRAGVTVRAGVRHAVAGIADQSTLFEVFMRRHRHTIDGSLGWGHNSQWKTDFRRDYLTASAYHFNVDAMADIDDDPVPAQADMTRTEQNNLLRYRCLVRPLENPAAENHPVPADRRLTVPRALSRGANDDDPPTAHPHASITPSFRKDVKAAKPLPRDARVAGSLARE